jgi:SprT-like family
MESAVIAIDDERRLTFADGSTGLSQSDEEARTDFRRTNQKNAAQTTGSDPTRTTYLDLTRAYDFYNVRLFSSRLPRCLITMQRCRTAYGYYAAGRFGTSDGSEVTDEVAINPSFLRGRTTEQVLSTLVHEMTHLEQQHFGEPGRGGYHNKEWARSMKAVGLVPSATGAPGGKETGERVSHYAALGGLFDLTTRDLLAEGFSIRYVELPGIAEPSAMLARNRNKAASKTRYSCPRCAMNAWGKPALSLICGDCAQPLRVAADAG